MIGDPVPRLLTSTVLSINLDAVCANYNLLLNHLNGTPLAAVVKANGYGLGAVKIGQALTAAGCKVFFVAHLDEGVTLRSALPNAEIHILNGLLPNALKIYREYALVPVLGSLGDLETWKNFNTLSPLPCDIHVDTGMLRLGLPPAELSILQKEQDRLLGLNVRFVMSHLASSEDMESKQNPMQLEAFKQARKILPMGKACFANSSGIFLSPLYHFNMARSGIAIYGANPTPSKPNPMTPTITLRAQIIQVRDAEPGDTIGYNATHRVRDKTRIATVPVGYADGFIRTLSNKAVGIIDDISVPLVGRVSMDLITFDVTNVPEEKCQPGQWVELIGAKNPIDSVAQSGGTIAYEILTSLGDRYHRTYIGGPG